MPLIDIGNGLKQYVPDGGNALEQQQQIMTLLQLKQEMENSRLQGEIRNQQLLQEQAQTDLIPQNRQKLLAEVRNAQLTQQKSEQDIAKERAAAFNDALDKIPQIIRSQGIEAANAYAQARMPGVTLTQPEKDGGVYFNLPNGVSLLTNPNPKPGQILNAKDLVQTEMALADDFEKATGTQHQALLAYDNIEKLAKKGKGGIDDVAILYMLIKGLDPGSTVREGEVNLTQSANPLAQRIALAYQRAYQGGAITPEQRQQYVALAQQQKAIVQGQLAPLIQKATERARLYGLSPENIVTPRGVTFAPADILTAPESVRKSLGLADTPGDKDRTAALEKQATVSPNIGATEEKLAQQYAPMGRGRMPWQSTLAQPTVPGLSGDKKEQEKKPSSSTLNEKLSRDLFRK